MAQLTGVAVHRLEGGLGLKNPASDGTVALIASLPSLSGLQVKNYEAKKLLQLSDAEKLGINAAYDANQHTLVHHHLSEIFRLAPEAVVYLIPAEKNKKLSAVLPQLLPAIRANQDIKGFGCTGFTDTDAELKALAQKVQTDLINKLGDENRLIDFVLLEGKAATTPVSVTNLPDLRNLAAPQVSVVFGQDPAVAALDNKYTTYAAVGSALGMLAVRKVNENISSIRIQQPPSDSRTRSDYPLTDTAKGKWLSASLSDGTPMQNLSKKDLNTLTDKGYIYAASYEGYGGIFFSHSPTCVEKKSDYGFIENNRTWNKAARLVRQTLLPEVKGVIKKDPKTGFIKSTTISYWQGLLNRALEQMIINDEISGFKAFIDPKQVLSADDPVKVNVQIVKDGIAYEFVVDLGYTQKI